MPAWNGFVSSCVLLASRKARFRLSPFLFSKPWVRFAIFRWILGSYLGLFRNLAERTRRAVPLFWCKRLFRCIRLSKIVQVCLIVHDQVLKSFRRVEPVRAKVFEALGVIFSILGVTGALPYLPSSFLTSASIDA